MMAPMPMLRATPADPLYGEEFLLSLLACPSAPFREKHAIERIVRELDAHEVPYFRDPIGNIVVGAASLKDYKKLVSQPSQEPLRFFIAHTDHPGLHGEKWLSPGRLAFLWHGGSPVQHLEGAKVWLATREGFAGEGAIESALCPPGARGIQSGVIRVEGEAAQRKAASLYGGFHFREFVWKEEELIYTKAADDLVGAFAIAELAIRMLGRKNGKKSRPMKKPRPAFLGLLTRAEEVGFIGAIGHFELGWLKRARRPVLGVSLETSRTLPGAEIGKGPVVRLGDRFTVFDSGALRVFTELAERELPGRHQRRVMDGGTCEASAATVYGFPCVGISVPLGNYHNQSFEGGPDSRGPNGPAPEFVHLQDIAGLQTLCEALLEPGLPWSKPWAKKAQAFKKSLHGYRKLLKSGP